MRRVVRRIQFTLVAAEEIFCAKRTNGLVRPGWYYQPVYSSTHFSIERLFYYSTMKKGGSKNYGLAPAEDTCAFGAGRSRVVWTSFASSSDFLLHLLTVLQSLWYLSVWTFTQLNAYDAVVDFLREQAFRRCLRRRATARKSARRGKPITRLCSSRPTVSFLRSSIPGQFPDNSFYPISVFGTYYCMWVTRSCG
jgi:hypothetical protein